MTVPKRDGRGAAARVLACSAALITVMTGLVLSTAQAEPPPDAALDPYLDLVEQDIVVSADGTFRLAFRIGGDLDGGRGSRRLGR